MQLIGKFNIGCRFLLCVIDIYSKYVWVVPLKDKGETIVNAFKKKSDDSKRRPNKIWVDKCSECYNNSFKKWLKDNDVEMYSTHNEKKLFLKDLLIRALKNKIYKYRRSISKNIYIDILDYIVNEYNNTYHRTIKMKPADVKSGNYVKYNVNSNVKDPRF